VTRTTRSLPDQIVRGWPRRPPQRCTTSGSIHLRFLVVPKLAKRLVIIKLGGSALTDKKRIYTPRMGVLQSAASQVAAVNRKCSIVLVHGAGSYGHIPVKKYGLTNGFRSSRQLKGLTETKSRLLEWHAIVDKAMAKRGVPVVPFIASSYVTARNGRIVSADLGGLKQWLRLGSVPSTGGDIVPDVKQGFSIVSGDQLAAHLAVRMKASQLVFGIDVDGIFDSNPKLNKNARLLSNLTVFSAARLLAKRWDMREPDVTGGMAGKLKEAVAAASEGIPVSLVNLTKDDRLRHAAQNTRVLGTRILPLRNS
jgi:isopentenyl phosphate kinase